MAATAHQPTRFRPAVRDTLFVSEIFPTLQGEGPHCGQPATFLRLMGCNLACSWCDTPYTWDHRRFDMKAEAQRMEVAEVYLFLQSLHPTRLVITGGEPLLQSPALGLLLNRIGAEQPWRVEVETNGTLPPPATWLFQVEQWNVSPKLAHSGNDPAKALNLSLLRTWASIRTARFKFVCKLPSDVEDVAKLAASLGILPTAVWIMPEGTTTPVQLHRLRRLVPKVLEHGFNLAPRLHVLIWGAERGR
jgi:7-carboxy-7-deazaguanine synthase